MTKAVSGKPQTETADRIAYCRLMAEEARRSSIGSEARASEWEDRAWRLEHGMDEYEG